MPGCPCGNSDPGGDAGCANSTGQGAALGHNGDNTISGTPGLILTATNAIPGQPGLFFQGDQEINGGQGIPFGDGLRCCGTNVIRLQVVVPNAHGTAVSTDDIATDGGVQPGDRKCYQFWYRNPTGSLCGAGFNLTNSVTVEWKP